MSEMLELSFLSLFNIRSTFFFVLDRLNDTVARSGRTSDQDLKFASHPLAYAVFTSVTITWGTLSSTGTFKSVLTHLYLRITFKACFNFSSWQLSFSPDLHAIIPSGRTSSASPLVSFHVSVAAPFLSL